MSRPLHNAPHTTLGVPAGAPEPGERATPFYCPYCGEEDLHPEPEPRAAWRCAGCTRVFVVNFVGLAPRDARKVSLMTSTQLDRHSVVAEYADRFEQATPGEVISWAADFFGAGLAIAASMQDGVVAHLASCYAPRTDVLFLDTGYHFAETIRTRDEIERAYGLNVIDVRPAQTVAEQDGEFGARLHDRDPNLCCRMRKTDPLDAALAGYDAWITGVRRSDSTRRASTPVLSYDRRRDIVKIAPLAWWTDADVDSYIEDNRIIVNPLRDQGFPSIGCAPCTKAVAPGADARSGRWAGFEKTECGIQL